MSAEKLVPEALSGKVPFRLHHTALDYQAHFDAQMEGLRLGRSEWLLLAHLYFCDGTNQQALAELMGIGKAAVGKLAKGLEEKGWIRREDNPDDMRARKLYIRPATKPIVGDLVDLLLLETDYSLKGFTEGEVRQLLDFLHRIRTNLSDATPSNAWLALKARTLLAIDDAGL